MFAKSMRKLNLKSRSPKRERAEIEVVVPTGIELESTKNRDDAKEFEVIDISKLKKAQG